MVYLIIYVCCELDDKKKCLRFRVFYGKIEDNYN